MTQLGGKNDVTDWRIQPGTGVLAASEARMALSSSATRSASLDTLVQACLAEAVQAFGLRGSGRGVFAGLLRQALRPRAERLAGQMLAYDAIVGAHGFQQGGA